MQRIFLGASLAAFVGACVADSESLEGSGEAGNSSSNGGATVTGDDSATSTSGATSTTTGSGSDDGSSGGPKFDVGLGTDSSPMTCDFAAELGNLAEQSKTPPTDCGIVDIDDGDQAWLDAHDCAVTAFTQTAAVQVGFQVPSIDSTAYIGFYGVVGFVYETGSLRYDTFGRPVLGATTCAAVVTLDDCVPSAGVHCLECVRAGEIEPYDCVP